MSFQRIDLGSAHVISASSMRCKSPRSPERLLDPVSVRIDVAVGEEVFMSSGVVFTYEPVPTIFSFHPTQVAAHGSSIVTVVGKGFSTGSSAGPFCRFGSQLVVPGRLVSQDVVECVLSSRQSAGNITVSMSLNRKDFYLPSTGDASITIVSDGVYDALLPSLGYVMASSVVTIIGKGFKPSSDALCCSDAFPSSASPSTFLTSTMRSCVVPAQSRPTVLRLELSTTGSCTHTMESMFTGLEFHVMHEPTLVGIKPSFGASMGGSVVTVQGRLHVHWRPRKSEMNLRSPPP